MTNQEDLPNVSMSNTKKELLDAYEEARKQLQARAKAVLDAEKVQDIANRAVAAAKREYVSVPFQSQGTGQAEK
jgi:hypothetical protein